MKWAMMFYKGILSFALSCTGQNFLVSTVVMCDDNLRVRQQLQSEMGNDCFQRHPELCFELCRGVTSVSWVVIYHTDLQVRQQLQSELGSGVLQRHPALCFDLCMYMTVVSRNIDVLRRHEIQAATAE